MQSGPRGGDQTDVLVQMVGLADPHGVVVTAVGDPGVDRRSAALDDVGAAAASSSRSAG